MWSSKKYIAPAIVVSAILNTACASVPQYTDYKLKFETNSQSSNLNGFEWSSTNTLKVNEISDSNSNEASISDIVNLVKVTLGLPNKDIADIFKVSRQTLHAYKSDETVHNLHEQNLSRAKVLKNIFEDINKILLSSPGALAKTYLINNETLFDILKSDTLEKEKILSFSQKLQKKIDQKLNINRIDQSDISLFELTRHA